MNTMICPGAVKIMSECLECEHHKEHDKNHECEDWDEHDHGCMACVEIKGSK
jgi:hypothetical protein